MAHPLPLPTNITDLIKPFKRDPDYGPNWQYGERAARGILEGVETRDYAKLIGLKDRGRAKFGRKVFTLLTGIKLPRTQRDSEARLREFCTPASIEAYEFSRLEQFGKEAAARLQQQRVADGGSTSTAKRSGIERSPTATSSSRRPGTSGGNRNWSCTMATMPSTCSKSGA